MKKLAQGFNTAGQDSNPGSLSRRSGALPLSHCALRKVTCDAACIVFFLHLLAKSYFGYRYILTLGLMMAIHMLMLA